VKAELPVENYSDLYLRIKGQSQVFLDMFPNDDCRGSAFVSRVNFENKLLRTSLCSSDTTTTSSNRNTYYEKIFYFLSNEIPLSEFKEQIFMISIKLYVVIHLPIRVNPLIIRIRQYVNGYI
jgi:hypothetical protein